jgi:hypothetical protein
MDNRSFCCHGIGFVMNSQNSTIPQYDEWHNDPVLPLVFPG